LLADFFILDRKRLLPVSRKNQTKNLPLSCFLHRWALDSIRIHGELFSHSKMFLPCKGQGSFKHFLKSRKCRGSKGISVDTTHTPLPLPGHFTLPLKRENHNKTFIMVKCIYCFYMKHKKEGVKPSIQFRRMVSHLQEILLLKDNQCFYLAMFCHQSKNIIR
jgi:hypothetical protein